MLGYRPIIPNWIIWEPRHRNLNQNTTIFMQENAYYMKNGGDFISSPVPVASLGMHCYLVNLGICGSVYVSTQKIHKSISYLRYAYKGKYGPRYIYIYHIREGEWPNAIAYFIYHLSICGICHIITGWGQQISDQVNIHVWFVKNMGELTSSFHFIHIRLQWVLLFISCLIPCHLDNIESIT